MGRRDHVFEPPGGEDENEPTAEEPVKKQGLRGWLGVIGKAMGYIIDIIVNWQS